MAEKLSDAVIEAGRRAYAALPMTATNARFFETMFLAMLPAYLPGQRERVARILEPYIAPPEIARQLADRILKALGGTDV